jgi:predicted PurR-regulated permease PerM
MQRDWLQLLLRLAVILATLLVALSAFAILYILVHIVQRFGNVVVLFTLGAIVAYVLNPAVNKVTAMLGKRSAGILAVYGGVVATLAILAVLLFQPLVNQSSSLVDALRNPPAASLHALNTIGTEARAMEAELQLQKVIATANRPIPLARLNRTQANITALQAGIAALKQTSAPVSTKVGRHGEALPRVHIQIPPTYRAPLERAASALVVDYGKVVNSPATDAPSSLARAVTDAHSAVLDARSLRRTVSATPLLLLDAQTWIDEHHIALDVQKSTGQAVKRLTDQAASILTNSASILTTTGTLLVDVMLILLISIYFVSDGPHMIHRGLEIMPDRYHNQARFFVDSVDSVLGKSIRANLALAGLAGLLGGLGAMVLGVPYAVLIGISTALLELVPIIGPVVLVIPPVIIALLFTTPTKAIILLIWYIVFQQIVTNVIGPRLTSKTVGIHPLEAMAAALLGFPLAGILGSFLAVPVVGLTHVLVKEAYKSWKKRRAKPAPENVGSEPDPGKTKASVSEVVPISS